MLRLSLGNSSHLGSGAHTASVAGHRSVVAQRRTYICHQVSQRHVTTIPHPRPPQRQSLRCAASISRNTTRSEKPLMKYDIDFWHYQPWWWQPRIIVTTGISVIAAFGYFSKDHVSTALWASLPVGLWWHVFLRILPSQFRNNAVQYIETHDMDDAL